MTAPEGRSWTTNAGFPVDELSASYFDWAGSLVVLPQDTGNRIVDTDQFEWSPFPEPAPRRETADRPDQPEQAETDHSVSAAPEMIEVSGPVTATQAETFQPLVQAIAFDFAGFSLPGLLSRAALVSSLPATADWAASPDLQTGPNTAGVDVSGFQQVNIDGWGDSDNVYAWAMFSFQGMLYVTTLTLDGTQPDNEGIRSEGSVYRYDGTDWEVVTENGFGNDHNDGFRCMYEYNGYIYTGSLNELDGAELWRSSNGVVWERVAAQGFGDPTNQAIREMAEFQGKLYVGTQNISLGAGDIWMSSDGVNFEPVTMDGFGNVNNSSFHCFIDFGGYLYVGTRNLDQGGEIWRTGDGDNWEQVVGTDAAIAGGFGTADNDAVFHMMTFKGALYATTGNSIDGFGLFRSTDGETWEQVGDYGFGNASNTFGWRMEVYDGALWLGASNSDPTQGGTLWRSTDGQVWEQMVGADSATGDDYGMDNIENWGFRSLEVYNDQLYVGSANYPYHSAGLLADGAQVFVWLDGTLSLTGTDDDDLINGSREGDTISGEAGSDVLKGRQGDDTIDGGNGYDSIRGGIGSDSIDGGNGNDTISGDNGFDLIEGGDGNDLIEGNHGRDTLYGNDGMDTLYGGMDEDWLYGGLEMDVLFGDNGADVLDGGRHFDWLDGGNGTDTLIGGAGDDTLTGGDGTDVFVYEAGRDYVTDFAQDKDELQLVSTLFTNAIPTVDEIIDIAAVQDGNLVFDFGSGNVLTLMGVTNANLLWNDIVIV